MNAGYATDKQPVERRTISRSKGRHPFYMSVDYPVTVDAKTLQALMMCGDSIIRNSQPQRIYLWRELKATIIRQAESTATNTQTIHKTCPNWGVTQCMAPLWPRKGELPKTSYRWRNVNCKLCLKEKKA